MRLRDPFNVTLLGYDVINRQQKPERKTDLSRRQLCIHSAGRKDHDGKWQLETCVNAATASNGRCGFLCSEHQGPLFMPAALVKELDKSYRHSRANEKFLDREWAEALVRHDARSGRDTDLRFI